MILNRRDLIQARFEITAEAKATKPSKTTTTITAKWHQNINLHERKSGASETQEGEENDDEGGRDQHVTLLILQLKMKNQCKGYCSS